MKNKDELMKIVSCTIHKWCAKNANWLYKYHMGIHRKITKYYISELIEIALITIWLNCKHWKHSSNLWEILYLSSFFIFLPLNYIFAAIKIQIFSTHISRFCNCNLYRHHDISRSLSFDFVWIEVYICIDKQAFLCEWFSSGEMNFKLFRIYLMLHHHHQKQQQQQTSSLSPWSSTSSFSTAKFKHCWISLLPCVVFLFSIHVGSSEFAPFSCFDLQRERLAETRV